MQNNSTPVFGVKKFKPVKKQQPHITAYLAALNNLNPDSVVLFYQGDHVNSCLANTDTSGFGASDQFNGTRSQPHQSGIMIDGWNWPSPENYFQAVKVIAVAAHAGKLQDQEVVKICNQLRTCPPMEVYRYVRANQLTWLNGKTINEYYSENLFANYHATISLYMLKAIYYKFFQYEGLKQFLLATNESVIIEASDKDPCWGIGEYPKHKGQPSAKLNICGKMLQEVRFNLSKGAVVSPNLINALNYLPPVAYLLQGGLEALNAVTQYQYQAPIIQPYSYHQQLPEFPPQSFRSCQKPSDNTPGKSYSIGSVLLAEEEIQLMNKRIMLGNFIPLVSELIILLANKNNLMNYSPVSVAQDINQPTEIVFKFPFLDKEQALGFATAIISPSGRPSVTAEGRNGPYVVNINRTFLEAIFRKLEIDQFCSLNGQSIQLYCLIQEEFTMRQLVANNHQTCATTTTTSSSYPYSPQVSPSLLSNPPSASVVPNGVNNKKSNSYSGLEIAGITVAVISCCLVVGIPFVLTYLVIKNCCCSKKHDETESSIVPSYN